MHVITEEEIKEVLMNVYDPELGINIVDLGLIMDIQISEKNDVQIIMTLTTPGCPLHKSINRGVEAALGSLPDIGEVSVDLVWIPPWTPERMSDKAKQQLGWGTRY